MYIWRTQYLYTDSKGLLNTIIKTDPVLAYSLFFADIESLISVTKPPEHLSTEAT